MSKIQDALKKLQSGSVPASDRQLGRRKDAAPIADLVAGVEAVREGEPESQHGVVIEWDQKALRDAGLIAPEYHEQLLADQYRDIKRPLIANAFGKRVAKVEDGNLIMVTSALPGEGKTFTSINLAISIAQEQDVSVLLVDADVAKPHISTVLGVGTMPGLLDILDGEVQSPESLVVPTDMDGLSVLPAGAPRPNATELLSGFKMESLVKKLADRAPNRIVVFDTPPLLRTSESKVLTAMAGQIVLVVKAEDTSQGAVGEALRVLGEDKAVNLILNQSRRAGSQEEYSYGYGYDRYS